MHSVNSCLTVKIHRWKDFEIVVYYDGKCNTVSIHFNTGLENRDISARLSFSCEA